MSIIKSLLVCFNIVLILLSLTAATGKYYHLRHVNVLLFGTVFHLCPPAVAGIEFLAPKLLVPTMDDCRLVNVVGEGTTLIGFASSETGKDFAHLRSLTPYGVVDHVAPESAMRPVYIVKVNDYKVVDTVCAGSFKDCARLIPGLLHLRTTLFLHSLKYNNNTNTI